MLTNCEQYSTINQRLANTQLRKLKEATLMKKTAALFSLVCALFALFAFSSSAVSINDGMDAMVSQFKDGKANLDYVYYSPVKNENDSTKYPLVVWLHGNSSGDYPGHQVRNSCIYNWSSEEYQKRFKGTEGAYLLLPRCPTGGLNPIAWGAERRNALKNTIDSFIQLNKDMIDTTRIYIGGYSMGGKMTIIMASQYPSFFAAAFPMSPVYEPTRAELKSMGNMPVWLFVNKNDRYISLDYNTVVKPNWRYFSKNCAFPQESRFTVFSTFYHAEGVENASDVHNTWDAVTYDMFMKSGEAYYASETVNANGETVSLAFPNGVISWLSSQSLDRGEDKISLNVIQMLIIFIKRLLSLIIVI